MYGCCLMLVAQGTDEKAPAAEKCQRKSPSCVQWLRTTIVFEDAVVRTNSNVRGIASTAGAGTLLDGRASVIGHEQGMPQRVTGNVRPA